MDLPSKATARLTLEADFSEMPNIDLDRKAAELTAEGYTVLGIDRERRAILLGEQEATWPAR